LQHVAALSARSAHEVKAVTGHGSGKLVIADGFDVALFCPLEQVGGAGFHLVEVLGHFTSV
jgi:hypothetical protein